MNEALRHEIVQRQQAGASIRAIAKALGIARGAVGRVLAQVQAQRDGLAAPVAKRRRRGSLLDAYEPILKELLARYPNLTVERAWQAPRLASQRKNGQGSHREPTAVGGYGPGRGLLRFTQGRVSG